MKTKNRVLAILCVSILTLCAIIAVNDVLAANSTNLYDTFNQTPLNLPTYGNWTYSNGSYCNNFGLAQSADGGYILAGNQLNIPITLHDVWLVKANAAGVMEWNKTYGSIGADFAYSIINCSDGGYAFTGYTTSYGANISDDNMWLVKIDTNGTLQWMTIYGGTGADCGLDVIQTSDGGYLVVGCTASWGVGSYDVYIVKTDSAGNMQWSKTFGYSSWDIAYGAVETADKGFAVAGFTNSSISDNDGWLIRLDSKGNQLWNKTYGGTYEEGFRSIVRTSTGFAMTGSVTFYKENKCNCWLLNVDENGTVLWSRTYWENEYCGSNDLVNTPDEGFALTGFMTVSGNHNDLLLLKVDKAGNMEWNQTIGGKEYDQGSSIIQTSYGYALGGESESYNSLTENQYWLILTDNNGRINYNLTTCTVGQGSISPGNQTCMSGTNVNLVAVPANGWTFKGWSGDASGAANTSIAMDNDKTVTATFTQIPYNLTIIAVGSGSVYPGNQSYTRGTNVSLSVVSNAGWTFSGWTGDASGTSNTTILMDANRIVTATFIQDKTPTPTPTATPSPTTSYSTPAPTSQASPSALSSPSPTPLPQTITQNPTPSVPELSLIILIPAVFSAIIAITVKRGQRNRAVF